MSSQAGAAAALVLCESLLLALEEKGVLSSLEIANLLADAVEALRHMAPEANSADACAAHEEAADLILQIRSGHDGVRSTRFTER